MAVSKLRGALVYTHVYEKPNSGDPRPVPLILGNLIPINPHVSYSLNSLMGGFIREYIGDYYGGCYCKGDTRSLENGACTLSFPFHVPCSFPFGSPLLAEVSPTPL